jgi:hypothetical protein
MVTACAAVMRREAARGIVADNLLTARINSCRAPMCNTLDVGPPPHKQSE